MQHIFSILKGIFFIVSLMMGLLFARGQMIFGLEGYTMIMIGIIPGYLLLLGFMIGYILANIQAAKYDKYPEHLHNIYKRGLVIGIVTGIIFVGVYLWLYNTGNIMFG